MTIWSGGEVLVYRGRHDANPLSLTSCPEGVSIRIRRCDMGKLDAKRLTEIAEAVIAGGSKGGKRSAAKLTRAQRIERAKLAARARWATKKGGK